jgi:hypothetical protein
MLGTVDCNSCNSSLNQETSFLFSVFLSSDLILFQVREGVGNLMCVVASNLEHLLRLQEGINGTEATVDDKRVVDGSVKKWSFEMVEGATAAAAKIQAGTGPSLGGTALAALGGVGPSSSANQDDEGSEGEAASKWMETVSFCKLSVILLVVCRFDHHYQLVL